MRDILNKLEYIIEAQTLSPATLKKDVSRFNNFINHISNGIPFSTVDGDMVIIDSDEVSRMKELSDNNNFSGAIKLKIKDSEETIGLNKLLKTSAFGGQAKGVDDGDASGKETALLKPSQIGITDRDIYAGDLGDEIINNPILASTEYGRAVIDMAKTIVEGGKPVMPSDIRNNSSIRASIIDYAGEYLGVLALVHGISRFPRKNSFEQWLGGSVNELTLNFPSKSNTNIADSYATIINKETKHSINISSKGQGGGAAPSLSGLKISNDIKMNPDFAAAIEFIELCKNKNLPSPSTVSQVFLAMNLLNKHAPESLPDDFKAFLPWQPSIVDEVIASINGFKQGKDPGLKRFKDCWENIKFRSPSSDGGKLTHAVKLAVMRAINEKNAIPEFKSAVLNILDMNFIQQYTDYDAKTGIISFATQWPARLEGNIQLESKSSGKDPTKGGFSFKLSPTKPKTDIEEPHEETYAEIAAKQHADSDMSTVFDRESDVLTNKKSTDIGRKKR